MEEYLKGTKIPETDFLIKICIDYNIDLSILFPEEINYYGFKLRVKRVQANLSTSELGKILNINRSSIFKIENRKVKGNSSIGDKIEQYLDTIR